MKPNELRINNYVKVQLCTNPIQIITNIMFNGIYTVDTENVDYADVEPIKLTDKWLINFGFEKTEWDNNNSFRKMVGNNDYTIVFYSNCICEIGDVIVKEIQYVHQLQNLYFALTENELQIAEAGKEN